MIHQPPTPERPPLSRMESRRKRGVLGPFMGRAPHVAQFRPARPGLREGGTPEGRAMQAAIAAAIRPKQIYRSRPGLVPRVDLWPEVCFYSDAHARLSRQPRSLLSPSELVRAQRGITASLLAADACSTARHA